MPPEAPAEPAPGMPPVPGGGGIPPCAEVINITEFHDGDTNETLVVQGGLPDNSIKILIPLYFDAYSASLDIKGQCFEGEPAMDIGMVNDISESMNESMEYMKNDTKDFIDLLLVHADNEAGLVSFETEAEIRKSLTNDTQELFDVIDSYEIGDRTCMACGIVKGIELLRDSCKKVRAMVLMTNGRANWCTYGVCEPEMAKKQAVEKAEEAWYYGIRVYTIPYADGTDTTTLEKIANVSHGKIYGYGTPMSDIYSDLEDLFISSPSDVSLDVGSDGDEEFYHPGEFLKTESVNFTSSLRDLMACECECCEVSGHKCLIDLEVSSETEGIIILDNLLINGCAPDSDEDGYNAYVDCDDNDPEVYPGAEEVCNGVDDDCDGEIDEGGVCETSYYCDADHDGYISKAVSGTCDTYECIPEGCRESKGNDCNDGKANIHPGAVDLCDGIDNNCDGIDNGCGGGGGGGVIRYCGDGKVQEWRGEECEKDEDCEEGFKCEECECVECEEDWVCSEWGECSQEGIQTRTCADNNDCGTSGNKPSESQACEYVGVLGTIPLSEILCGNGECEEGEDCESCPEDCGECVTEGAGITGMFTGLQGAAILGLAIIVVLAFLAFFFMKKKK